MTQDPPGPGKFSTIVKQNNREIWIAVDNKDRNKKNGVEGNCKELIGVINKQWLRCCGSDRMNQSGECIKNGEGKKLIELRSTGTGRGRGRKVVSIWQESQ